MITYLAILFVVGLIGAILYGFGIVMKRSPSEAELATDTCTLCKRRFDKTLLVERTVGDYRVLLFCRECIDGLKADASAGQKLQ